jgi:List-Bact-rpt repeat protein
MIKALKVCLVLAVLSFCMLRFVDGGISAQPYQSDAAGTYPLLLTVTGSGGGSVNSVPNGLASTGGARSFGFTAYSTVTLIATADKDSIFVGWSGDCPNTTGDCVVTMDAVKTVTATFDAGVSVRTKAATTYPLTVSIEGAGGGSVNFMPYRAPLSEGASSADFPANSTVSLIATADGNSTFAGWSGDCSNTTGDCVMTMDAAKSVTVTFDAGPFIRTTSETQY